ncbi:MAG: tetratricopeptide repeat protein [Clostridium sp.]
MSIENIDDFMLSAYESYNSYQLCEAYEKIKKGKNLYGNDLKIKLLEGKILLALNRVKEAMDIFSKIVSKHIDNREAFMELGCLKVRVGELEEGYDLLKKAIELNKEEQEGKLTFAKVCLDLGKYLESRDVYKELINIYPPHVIGSNFISANKFLIREINKNEILTLEDKLNLARSYYYITEVENANEIIGSINLDKIEKYNDLIVIGGIYSANDNNKKALEIYDIAIEREPENTRAYIVKGAMLRKMGALLESYNVLKNVPINEEKDKDVYGTIAMVAYEIGKFKESLDYCEKAIESERALHSSYYLKARILNRLRDYDEGLKAIDKALNIYGGDGDYYAEKSKSLRGLGYIREANEICEKALEYRLETANINLEKGLILKSIGYYENAVSWLDVAIEMNEKDIVAKFAKAICLYYNHEKDSAIEMLNSIIVPSEYDGMVFGGKILVASTAGDYEEAVRALEEYNYAKNKKLSGTKKIAYELAKEIEKSLSELKFDDEYLEIIKAVEGLSK